MGRHVVPAPGGREEDLVLARWPDGWFATRYLGVRRSSGWSYNRSPVSPGLVIALNDRRIDSHRQSWVSVGETHDVSFGVARGTWYNRDDALLMARKWLGLLEATTTGTEYGGQVVAHATAMTRRITKQWPLPDLDLPCSIPVEIEAYRLLETTHPVWQPEDTFREWLDQAEDLLISPGPPGPGPGSGSTG